MLTKKIYNESLIVPAQEGADELLIISGYATSAMAFHHISEITKINSDIKVSLLVGMVPSDGISISNHKGFQSIMGSDFQNRFSCSYVSEAPAVHSKLYIWKKKNVLYKSFIGSVNYTQNAFLKNERTKQREILSQISDLDVIDYYSEIEKDSIYCNHSEIENYITVYSDYRYYRKHKMEVHSDTESQSNLTSVESVRIPLISSRDGEVQSKGGLNWGQRPGREPNQAYIQLTPDVYNSDFFPPKPQHFTVVTDDSKVFICARAQKDENGQAIETPHNNSLLGEYFRHRLGLSNGAYVNRLDLERYGRVHVTFYKIDDENYLMDFSKADNYF
jgi:hypothetical protein